MQALPARQSGITSIYVMIILIAASTIALGLFERESLELARTSQFVNAEQAMEYAYGAEAYARQMIFDYAKNWTTNDHTKPWNPLQPQFDIPDGTIAMSIQDMGGRFNVNSLLANDRQANHYFSNLCTLLGIPPEEVQSLVASMQPKQGTSNTGNASAPPLLMETSQLIDYGLSEHSYEQLAPYVMAVPELSHFINVNTASDIMLQAYQVPRENINAIQSMIQSNTSISVNDFGSLKINNLALTLLTTSDAFKVHSIVSLHGQTMELNSMILLLPSNSGYKRPITVARVWGK